MSQLSAAGAVLHGMGYATLSPGLHARPMASEEGYLYLVGPDTP
jgi:hypothetical protein